MGVKKRLLLDGITLHSGNVAPRSVEFAAVVEANLADSGLTFGDGATVAAGMAAQAIAIQLFPESGVGFADASVGGQNVAQCRHGFILRGDEDENCISLASLGMTIPKTKFRLVLRRFRGVVLIDPGFGLLARIGHLGSRHLKSQTFEPRLAAFVASSNRDFGPHVGFGQVDWNSATSPVVGT